VIGPTAGKTTLMRVISGSSAACRSLAMKARLVATPAHQIVGWVSPCGNAVCFRLRWKRTEDGGLHAEARAKLRNGDFVSTCSR